MRAEELSAAVEALDVRDGAARGVIADLLDDADRHEEAALLRSPQPVRLVGGFLYSKKLAYYVRRYPPDEGVFEVYCCPASLRARFEAAFPQALRVGRTLARGCVRDALVQSSAGHSPRRVTMFGRPFGAVTPGGLREEIERCVAMTVDAVVSVEWWFVVQAGFKAGVV